MKPCHLMPNASSRIPPTSAPHRRATRLQRLFGLCALLFALPAAQAAGDLTRQEPLVITLQVGCDATPPRFSPDTLTLESGRLYALRLMNGGSKPCYFGSQALADAVYSRKVVALDATGTDGGRGVWADTPHRGRSRPCGRMVVPAGAYRPLRRRHVHPRAGRSRHEGGDRGEVSAGRARAAARLARSRCARTIRAARV